MAAADSSVIRIPQTQESSTELRENDHRSPYDRSPIRITMSTTPNRTPTQVTATKPASSIVVDKTLSSAANLVKLLPSGTVLAFQALAPSFSNKGACHTSNVYLTACLIFICVLSCIFFSFTDSVIGRDGKLYYGLATPRSFVVFNYDGPDEDRSKVFKDLSRYRIRCLDYVHAVLSLFVFLALTFSDNGVQQCFFPNADSNAKEVLVNLPLGAGFFSSLLFMLFPSTRKGIGYSDATPHSQ